MCESRVANTDWILPRTSCSYKQIDSKSVPVGHDGVLTERRKFISRSVLTRRNDTSGRQHCGSYLESEWIGNPCRIDWKRNSFHISRWTLIERIAFTVPMSKVKAIHYINNRKYVVSREFSHSRERLDNLKKSQEKWWIKVDTIQSQEVKKNLNKDWNVSTCTVIMFSYFRYFLHRTTALQFTHIGRFLSLLSQFSHIFLLLDYVKRSRNIVTYVTRRYFEQFNVHNS